MSININFYLILIIFWRVLRNFLFLPRSRCEVELCDVRASVLQFEGRDCTQNCSVNNIT